MPNGMKACGHCQKLNHNRSKACKYCKTPFPSKEQRVAAVSPGKRPVVPTRKALADEAWPEHRDAALVDFVPGLTADGRLVLTWPAQYDRVTLTPKQTELVRALLNGRHAGAAP